MAAQLSLPSLHRLLWCAVLASGCAHNGEADLDAALVSAVDAKVDAANQSCREPGPANDVRKLVVARPYGVQGVKANAWEVLELSATGEISGHDEFFEMGRGLDGVVAFTPDGEIGLVAQEDGSVGIFRFNRSGEVEVLHAALKGDFYASSVVISPSGDRAYVISRNWRNNGGGIYGLKIGCDDSIEDEGLLVEAKLPGAPIWKSNGELLLVAHDVADSAAGQDLHMLDGQDLDVALASAQAFPDREAIVSGFALTSDQKYALLGDTSGFSSADNRIAVVGADREAFHGLQVLTPIEDPRAIATSPFDDAALVVSGFEDALIGLSYNPNDAQEPFAVQGEIEYQGGTPALPGDLVSIDRGDLRGMVLVAENQGVRRVRFAGGGLISDLGRTEIGTGFAAVTGAIGLQP